MVKQKFKIPVKIFKDGNEVTIIEKEWTPEELGMQQVEEVWRYYKDNIWVSNYGYVMQLTAINLEKVLQNSAEEKCNEFYKSYKDIGFVFRDLCYVERKIVCECIIDPKNKVSRNKNDNYKSCQADLCIEELGDKKLYHLVAEVFLDKKVDQIVHHIDNNSYNNSVMNLICIDDNVHSEAANGRNLLHPFRPGPDHVTKARLKNRAND